MTPDDPRHGTHAGYKAGCRSCEPCKAANAAYQRERARRKREGIPLAGRAPAKEHPHGTANRRKSAGCMCEYCVAAHRVQTRAAALHVTETRKRELKTLEASVAEAYLKGEPVPELARRQEGYHGAPQPMIIRRVSAEEMQTVVAAREAAQAVAHEARLRAALKAEGDPMRLALWSVAEIAEDDLRAARYARVAEALA